MKFYFLKLYFIQHFSLVSCTVYKCTIEDGFFIFIQIELERKMWFCILWRDWRNIRKQMDNSISSHFKDFTTIYYMILRFWTFIWNFKRFFFQREETFIQIYLNWESVLVLWLFLVFLSKGKTYICFLYFR